MGDSGYFEHGIENRVRYVPFRAQNGCAVCKTTQKVIGFMDLTLEAQAGPWNNSIPVAQVQLLLVLTLGDIDTLTNSLAELRKVLKGEVPYDTYIQEN